jgi:hypothetical protein
MVRVGTVALDGTKLAGNAADKANRTQEKLEAEVAEILRQATDADQREDRLFGDARRDELPEALPARRAGWRGCARPRPSWIWWRRPDLWQLLEQPQVVLACWAGACPTCRRPAPHWLSPPRSRAPT